MSTIRQSGTIGRAHSPFATHPGSERAFAVRRPLEQASRSNTLSRREGMLKHWITGCGLLVRARGGVSAAVLVLGIASVALGQSDPSGFGTVINLPDDQPSMHVTSTGDIQLNVHEGGTVTAGSGIVGFDGDAEVNVDGGTIQDNFSLLFGVLNMSGGTIENHLHVLSSTANISGGSISSARLLENSTINMSGGSFGLGLLVSASNLDINISGGVFGPFGGGSAAKLSSSTVTLSGGVVSRGVHLSPTFGNELTIVGGDFRLNGVPVVGDTFSYTSSNDVMTGVLEDGSPFIFTSAAGDFIGDVALNRTSIPSIDPTPIVLSTPTQAAPPGLRSGQSLMLEGTGEIGVNFGVLDADLTINGGTVGEGLEAARSRIAIAGGTVGDHFEVYDSEVTIEDGVIGRRARFANESTVNISGGEMGGISVDSGSTINMSGGTIGERFRVSFESTLNITGGSIGKNLVIDSGARVNIYGGTIDPNLAIFGEMHLFGNHFALNGVPMDHLTIGEPLTVMDRDVELSGILDDGTAFSFMLDTFDRSPHPYYSPESLLTVTLTPEPGTGLLLLVGGVLGAAQRRGRRGHGDHECRQDGPGEVEAEAVPGPVSA